MAEKIPFVDCEGLAGAWTLGTVQTGEFELIARRSLPGGFGDMSVDANRELLGDGDWYQQTGPEAEWDPVSGVGYMCGTPPCSGFSLLNTSKGENARGSGSVINTCMKAFVRYAGRCTGTDLKLGPEVVSFESVQGAFKQGRTLMQELRDDIEKSTGQHYDLTHVLMSGASIGCAQMRRRYYPVFHRIPLKITTPEKRHVVTYQDAIGDLVGAELRREWQPYPDNSVRPSDFAVDKRTDDGYFDMHLVPESGAYVRVVNELAPYWKPGEQISKAVKRLGRKPDSIKDTKYLGVDQKEPLKGWSWPTRIHPDKPGYVITGGGILSFVHWAEDRMLSVRELSRLMGYPDDWSWDFTNSPMNASLLIGKCCPVQSGRWISQQIADAHRANQNGQVLDRGDVQPAADPFAIDREYIHNSTNAYMPWLKEQLAEKGLS